MRDDIREKIASNIQQYGQHVVCGRHSAGDPPDFQEFAYTIGNHGAGLPELLLIGGSDSVYGRIVNALGAIQRERGIAFRHGEKVDYGARLPARIIDAGHRARDEYAVQAGVFYRTDAFEVRQILLSDQNGIFPHEPGCLPPYCDQPVLAVTH